MSNVIAFLESMGRGTAPATGTAEFAEAVAALDVGDEARSALLAGDIGSLADLLGGRPKMICMLFPADDAPAKEDEPQPEGEEPDEKKESVRH